MDKLYKILRKQTVATLIKDYTLPCSETVFRKGTTFNVKRMNEKGVTIVMGHGLDGIIPRNLFGQYICTWVEVYKNGDTTTHKKKRKDVTKEWNEHWSNVINKNKATQQQQQEMLNKLRSKELKSLIKFVKSGEAEKELASIDRAKTS